MLDIFAQTAIAVEEVDNWQIFNANAHTVAITVSDISIGMLCDDFELIAESQLFGNRVQQKRRRKSSRDNTDTVVKSLTELKLGAAVVHIDHGIGRYLGLRVIEVDNQRNEFLTLKYADDAVLYVPVSSLHLISRYSGADNDKAPLHRLGNEQWQKAKRKAAEKVHDVAAELLDIYARRAAREGFAHQTMAKRIKNFPLIFPLKRPMIKNRRLPEF